MYRLVSLQTLITFIYLVNTTLYHIISHISQLVIIPTLKEALSHYIIKALSHYIYHIVYIHIYHHVGYYPNSESLITYHIYISPLVIIPTLKKALSLYNQSLITFYHRWLGYPNSELLNKAINHMMWELSHKANMITVIILLIKHFI